MVLIYIALRSATLCIFLVFSVKARVKRCQRCLMPSHVPKICCVIKTNYYSINNLTKSLLYVVVSSCELVCSNFERKSASYSVCARVALWCRQADAIISRREIRSLTTPCSSRLQLSFAECRSRVRSWVRCFGKLSNRIALSISGVPRHDHSRCYS